MFGIARTCLRLAVRQPCARRQPGRERRPRRDRPDTCM